MKRFALQTLWAATCLIAAMVHPGPAPAWAQAPDKPVDGAHSPQAVNEEIEASAKAARERGDAPVARFRKFIVAWPDDVNAYAKMANYVVMLLTVITQDSRELPVDRVYIRVGSADLPLRKIWSTRSEFASGTFAAKMFGRHREDGFYLVPGGRLMLDGALLADFTSRRVGMSVMQLPTEQGSKYLGLYPSTDPARRAKPDASTFKTLMAKNFPGYPVPRL